MRNSLLALVALVVLTASASANKEAPRIPRAARILPVKTRITAIQNLAGCYPQDPVMQAIAGLRPAQSNSDASTALGIGFYIPDRLVSEIENAMAMEESPDKSLLMEGLRAKVKTAAANHNKSILGRTYPLRPMTLARQIAGALAGRPEIQPLSHEKIIVADLPARDPGPRFVVTNVLNLSLRRSAGPALRADQITRENELRRGAQRSLGVLRPDGALALLLPKVRAAREPSALELVEDWIAGHADRVLRLLLGSAYEKIVPHPLLTLRHFGFWPRASLKTHLLWVGLLDSIHPQTTVVIRSNTPILGASSAWHIARGLGMKVFVVRRLGSPHFKVSPQTVLSAGEDLFLVSGGSKLTLRLEKVGIDGDISPVLLHRIQALDWSRVDSDGVIHGDAILDDGSSLTEVLWKLGKARAKPAPRSRSARDVGDPT